MCLAGIEMISVNEGGKVGVSTDGPWHAHDLGEVYRNNERKKKAKAKETNASVKNKSAAHAGRRRKERKKKWRRNEHEERKRNSRLDMHTPTKQQKPMKGKRSNKRERRDTCKTKQ